MSSPPAIPGNRAPQDEADYRFQINGTACEWGEAYHPGGYHPVHLGDTFRNRYRVIRKIGYGSYSTVWLAIDLQLNRYVALKIAVAKFDQAAVDKEISLYQRLADAGAQHSGSQYLVCLQDSFKHLGPNGRHACFVFEPMGPNLTMLLGLLHPTFQLDGPWEQQRFPTQFAKQALREILLGLQFLHTNGVVHGDLHMGNILVNIRPITVDDASLRKLEQSPSQGDPLERLDNKVDPWAPLYLLQPASLFDYVSLDLDPHVKITDLGAAFPETHPPVNKVVMPAILRAPELVFGLPFGNGIDIWSFGCLVFELLTGSQLFQAEPLEGGEFDEEFQDEYLLQLSEILRPLPEVMFTKWRRGREYFDPDGQRLHTWDDDDQGYSSSSDAEGVDSDERNTHVSSHNSDAEGAESDERKTGVSNDHSDAEGTEGDERKTGVSSHSVPLASTKPFHSLEKLFKRLKPEAIGDEEEKVIVQLIHWILQHDPLQRPSATEILQHPWFRS